MAKKKPKDESRAIRAITLPIRCAVEKDGTEDPKILDRLRDVWRLSTDLANWCQRELVIHDLRRQPGEKKIGKYEAKMFDGGVGLYGHVNAACPFRKSFDGAAGSMSSITKAVEDAWRSHPRFGRFAVLWKGEASPAVFRFPYPWPVRSQELKVFRDKQSRPRVSVTLPGGRVDFRIGDGPDFRRQLRAFDVLLGDPTRLKAAKITGRRKAGKMVGADIRIVGSFDAMEKKEGVAAVVRTDPNALLVAEVEGRQPWILNCDNIVRQHKSHKVFLQRIGEDLKHEKRLTKSQRAGTNAAREKRCDKHASRMDTALHQISAQLVGYLMRCEVREVVYDDGIKEYIPDGFPWAKLAERIAYKLSGCGVEVFHNEPVTIGGE